VRVVDGQVEVLQHEDHPLALAELGDPREGLPRLEPVGAGHGIEGTTGSPMRAETGAVQVEDRAAEPCATGIERSAVREQLIRAGAIGRGRPVT
jgi:hypothetical protein